MTNATALTIGREALLPALTSVVKVIEKRNTIPVMQNVLLRAEGGRLTLTGSDLDAEISATVECARADDATFTLPAATLLDAVRKLPEGVEIGLSACKDFATVSAARSAFACRYCRQATIRPWQPANSAIHSRSMPPPSPA